MQSQKLLLAAVFLAVTTDLHKTAGPDLFYGLGAYLEHSSRLKSRFWSISLHHHGLDLIAASDRLLIRARISANNDPAAAASAI